MPTTNTTMTNIITNIITNKGIHTSHNVTICMSLGHEIKTKKSSVEGRMEVGAVYVSEEVKIGHFGHPYMSYTFA